MKRSPPRSPPRTHARRRCFAGRFALIALAALPAAAQAQSVEGFTEPSHSIDVAAAEPGIVVRIEVREAQRVAEGQVLARLDADVLEATLLIARELRDAKGQLESALAEASLKAHRAAQLAELRRQDAVTADELFQAEAEKRVAEANVLVAREALRVKQLEHERVKAQLERRLVRSPIGGVVTEIHKDRGECVTAIDPVVMTVVQLDPLLAIFSVAPGQADALSVGAAVKVGISSPHAAADHALDGTIETVSPVAHAQSGTVRVKVRLPNPEGRIRSGVKCRLILPDAP